MVFVAASGVNSVLHKDSLPRTCLLIVFVPLEKKREGTEIIQIVCKDTLEPIYK
jgi:hypothetical protein